MKYWLGLLSVCFAALSVAADNYQEGTHYSRIGGYARVTGENIQVEEIFSYTCGACFAFEGKVNDYKAELADDVEFVHTHIIWDKTTENLARAMYTAKALNVMETIHPALFQAIHVERKPVRTQEEIYQVFADAGVDIDEETFIRTLNSFSINTKVKAAKRKMSRYGVDSTPQIVVNGQYRISATEDIDHNAMLSIADHLVEEVRQAR